MTAGIQSKELERMNRDNASRIELACPCCGARLTIDRQLGKVIAHEEPPHTSVAPDLDRATELLRKQQARREALFAQSAEDEKIKSQVLEEKFRERLKKTKDEPITRPTRDFDLD